MRQKRVTGSRPISIPAFGREQSGRRPALVVSPADFCWATEFAIVCPITSRIRPFGTSVVLPPGLPVSGEILTSHVRSIDTLARPISYAGAAVPAEILHDVRCFDRTLEGRRPSSLPTSALQVNVQVRRQLLRADGLDRHGHHEIGDLQARSRRCIISRSDAEPVKMAIPHPSLPRARGRIED